MDLSGRKYVGKGDRKAGKKGRFQKFAPPEDERLLIFPFGEAKDGHAVFKLIDDPVLRDAEPLIEPELLLPVPDRRSLGEDFDDQVRNPLDTSFGDDGQAFFGDIDQIRLDNLKGIGG